MDKTFYGLAHNTLHERKRERENLLKFAHYEWSNVILKPVLVIYLIVVTKHLIEQLKWEKISFGSLFKRQGSHKIKTMWLLLISWWAREQRDECWYSWRLLHFSFPFGWCNQSPDGVTAPASASTSAFIFLP